MSRDQTYWQMLPSTCHVLINYIVYSTSFGEEQERCGEAPLTPFLERLETRTKLPFLWKYTRKRGGAHTLD